jgi:hypothetical protein
MISQHIGIKSLTHFLSTTSQGKPLETMAPNRMMIMMVNKETGFGKPVNPSKMIQEITAQGNSIGSISSLGMVDPNQNKGQQKLSDFGIGINSELILVENFQNTTLSQSERNSKLCNLYVYIGKLYEMDGLKVWKM